jgi:hypothetical protein
MKTSRFLSVLLLSMLFLTACTTVGTGGGQLSGKEGAEVPVAFNWTSTDGGMSGTMTAQLPGAVFQGPFFQITQQTRGETLSPLWTHWHQGWNDWPYWSDPFPSMYPSPQFITHYSGKVVATLESSNNQRMRCRFHLVVPSRGMSGGGEGECQLSQGRVVRAVFKSN